jgi:hypothetical protein
LGRISNASSVAFGWGLNSDVSGMTLICQISSGVVSVSMTATMLPLKCCTGNPLYVGFTFLPKFLRVFL